MDQNFIKRDLFGSIAIPVKSAVKSSILLQALTVLPAMMVLDGGLCFGICLFAAAGWWCAAITILIRRPQTTNLIDLGILRLGYPTLLPFGVLLSPWFGWIWNLFRN